MKRIHVIGYPSAIGGASTELWHTLRLWRANGLDITLIPTWNPDPKWRAKCDSIGCDTLVLQKENIAHESLAGATIVSMCNGEFLKVAGQFRAIGCKIIWVNCMTFLFNSEKTLYKQAGTFDRYVFQSQYQRDALEKALARYVDKPALRGYVPARDGRLIRGAFDMSEFPFAPKAHEAGEPYVIGRMARADKDKWSSNIWKIYGAIPYENKRALIMGVDSKVKEKIKEPPAWASCLTPNAIPVQQFLSNLHCLLPVNGGAGENWPRAGLEAFAAGVSVVAQNHWGWREMISHGETGFLGSNDSELAYYAALLAYDESLRMRIINNAYARMRDELANPATIWQQWAELFTELE